MDQHVKYVSSPSEKRSLHMTCFTIFYQLGSSVGHNIYRNLIWLVVSTPLKNISQWEGLFHILWKIKNV